ncbi:MAG: ABC transporter ATP-binding protein [Arcobacteraceae bacterium]|nr:ABC transporter ATP-binding protein [Arcobacteraceae bacterium]
MIKLQNITKEYIINKDEKVIALNNINIEVKKGELVVLKGASGSGKSTVLSLIASLTKPTHGEVIVNDTSVAKLSDSFASDFRLENIGFIFQKYNLILNISVKDNIILPLIPINTTDEFLNKRLKSVMNIFNIIHKENIIVKNLSGGEQQRVAIARSMVNDPDLILADEPTANLDEKLSLNFIETLKELKSLGKTIVVATHDPLFFELPFVDKIINMQNGKIIN